MIPQSSPGREDTKPITLSRRGFGYHGDWKGERSVFFSSTKKKKKKEKEKGMVPSVKSCKLPHTFSGSGCLSPLLSFLWLVNFSLVLSRSVKLQTLIVCAVGCQGSCLAFLTWPKFTLTSEAPSHVPSPLKPREHLTPACLLRGPYNTP